MNSQKLTGSNPYLRRANDWNKVKGVQNIDANESVENLLLVYSWKVSFKVSKRRSDIIRSGELIDSPVDTTPV